MSMVSTLNIQVALWLDSRSYNMQKPLREVSGFVTVTPKIHDEFVEHPYQILNVAT